MNQQSAQSCKSLLDWYSAYGSIPYLRHDIMVTLQQRIQNAPAGSLQLIAEPNQINFPEKLVALENDGRKDYLKLKYLNDFYGRYVGIWRQYFEDLCFVLAVPADQQRHLLDCLLLPGLRAQVAKHQTVSHALDAVVKHYYAMYASDGVTMPLQKQFYLLQEYIDALQEAVERKRVLADLTPAQAEREFEVYFQYGLSSATKEKSPRETGESPEHYIKRLLAHEQTIISQVQQRLWSDPTESSRTSSPPVDAAPSRKYCTFHRSKNHNTDDCRKLQALL
ncbi:hypothetical protein NEHOM01_1570 [Nematocida homosporus]|uniref:uncharacterized protein n=1 Tax=Nematocida homosporus TaxID=1912981 RepID=UPI002220CCA7|nr:uncharacterized protein NEHOM01_1570 [Nematocida homosporus]KAI5186584.1 hypothetical protein NEHOM01_1570 [Nematocida homosporus]